MECGRSSCITCNQEGDDRPNCTRANVVYESICSTCNPGAKKKGELEQMERAPRTIQERAQEHWGAARRKEETNHMVRHLNLEHRGEDEEPKFVFKVVS